MMNQPNEGSNENALLEVPVKRKRGRPRKYPRHEGVDGVHPRQTNIFRNANFPVVGQEVHGAVEGVFDGGFLIGVWVENSAAFFRGAVFMPGHYVPVSQENDVAPNLPMIRRNEVSSPLLRSVRNPCRHKRNRAANQDSSYVVGAEENQVHLVSRTGPPQIPKSNMVPVVLQPSNMSNRVPLTNQTSPMRTQRAHLSTKAKQLLLEADYPSNDRNELVAHPQASMQSEMGQPLAEGVCGSEAELKKLPGMSFEELVTEVCKRVEAPSESEERSRISAGNLIDKGSGHDVENQGDYKFPVLEIEPLQSVQPSQDCCAISTEPSNEGVPGKFNELLKVIQEQVKEHELITEKTFTSRRKLDVVRSPESMEKQRFCP